MLADLCRLERFDWVLMDVHMPIMDGLEATRRLRAQATTTQTVIIASRPRTIPPADANARRPA